ncbi:ankyrin [Colletotrichum somersetense]|nr:ankyrin [Colletotrichum somersetense]
MGHHNVVIASLPAGVIGVTSAATCAMSLLASLHSIRVGLLVGKGGGIARPDEGRDIRLGDIVIVVSQPDGMTGGVCQYDLFKAKHGNKKERKGFLNQPPTVLLSALASIQASHKREDSKVTDFMQAMIEKYPKMGRRRGRKDPGFTYQGIENDLQHDARDSTDPEIHYGIIASGNTLIKDAVARDQIVENVGEDYLCFEMEAAGLMNEFPCLVIRGICDYADSPKNGRWQQYASATAAAYGKGILFYVPVTEVRETKRALDVLESVDNKLDHLKQTTFETKAAVVHIAPEHHVDKIMRWLQPPDPSTNSNQARKLRYEGTGMWLLEHPVFQSWCSGSRRYSWLHGLAGCGKTVLSTTVLDHLASNRDRWVLSFFFDISDTRKQNLDCMLRSLVFQLYQSTATGTTRLDDLFRNHENGRHQPATKAMADVLCEMLATSTGVCIALDALDESTSRLELLQWMEDIVAKPDLAYAQLLCTARPEPEFLVRLDHMTGKESWISLDRMAVNTDIREYVAGQLSARWEFQQKNLSQDLIEQIMTKVGGGADGMFRWAACQLNSLAECRSPRMIRDALQHLPKDLEETCERMPSNIPKRDKDNVIRLLLEVTGVFGQKEKKLHLAHLSVKEYLRSAKWFGPYASSIVIRKTCLTYLRGVSGIHVTIEGNYPFAKLAAEIWASHAASSQSREEIFQASLAFMKEEKTDMALSRCCFGIAELLLEKGAGVEATTVCSAISHGRIDIMEMCLEKRAVEDGLDRALEAAASRGHLGIVKLLSDKGANVTANAVRAAASYGRIYIIKLFLEKKEAVNSGLNGTLGAAASGGHLGITKLLLEKGVYISGNAIEAAAVEGHGNVVELLLDKGVNLDAQNGDLDNALQAAVSGGHSNVVKLLLKKGADANVQVSTLRFRQCGYALQTASWNALKDGETDLVELLLDNGSYLDVEGKNHWALIQKASKEGNTGIVKLGLEKLTDFGAESSHLNDALQAAHNRSFGDIVKILLKRLADTTTESNMYGLALETDSKRGHSDLVKLTHGKGIGSPTHRVKIWTML